MCRLLGYVGPRVELDGLLYGPQASLERQSWSPRDQRHGTVNADGWGVGWYDRRRRPEPARYRTTTPMWADRNFADMAPVLASDFVVAAVRDATVGMPVVETATPPFRSGRWLFAHNGVVPGFHHGVGTALRRTLSVRRESELVSGCDSELVFALLLERLDGGLTPVKALRDTIAAVGEAVVAGGFDDAGARLNLLLGDGDVLHAARHGDTLVVSATDTPAGPATLVASEALDDDPGWAPVPEGAVLSAARDGVEVQPEP